MFIRFPLNLNRNVLFFSPYFLLRRNVTYPLLEDFDEYLVFFLLSGPLACNLSEPIGAQCFGALGEPLIFYQPTTTWIYKKSLKKNTVSILKITNNTIENLNNDYSNRFALFINATFKLDKATKNESGDYQLETFDSEGRALPKVNFHLEILGKNKNVRH